MWQDYFLRSIQLFVLVRVYGGVPIVNKVIDASDRDGATAYVRESVEKCIEQVVKDLSDAAGMLPTRKEWGDSQYGRLTKEAALAYKSRVLLFYASPIFNKNWNDAGNIRWQQALKATQDAMSGITASGLNGVTDAVTWGKILADDDNEHSNRETLVV